MVIPLHSPRIYVFRRSVIYVNLSNETIDLFKEFGSEFTDDTPQDGPYQCLLGAKVYVNGALWRNFTLRMDNITETREIVVKGLPRELSPGEELNITLVFAVALFERKPPLINPEEAKGFDSIPRKLRVMYTAETSLWNYSHPVIRRVLNEVNGSTPLEVLLSALKWIDENVVYRSHVPPLKPWEVVERGEGDCDEQANLLITLLRGKGVPARLAYGIVYLEGHEETIEAGDGIVEAITKNCGWHAWVEAYIPPWGWVPVDLTLGGEDLDHVTRACLYTYDTIIMGRIVRKDYIQEDIEAIREAQRLKLKIVCYDVLEDPPRYSTAATAATVIYVCLGLIAVAGAAGCAKSLYETRYRRSLGVKA